MEQNGDTCTFPNNIFKILKTREELISIAFTDRTERPELCYSFNCGILEHEVFGAFKFSAALPAFLPPEFYPKNSETPEIAAEVINTIKVVETHTGISLEPQLKQKLSALVDYCLKFYNVFQLPKEKHAKYLIVALHALVPLLDDWIEKTNMLVINPGILPLLIDTLHCKTTCGDNIRARLISELEVVPDLDPEFAIALEIFAKVVIAAMKVIPGYSEHNVQSSIVDFLCALRVLKMENKFGTGIPGPLFHYASLVDVGVPWVMEHAAWYLQITIPNTIKSSALFQWAIYHFGAAARCINDICGLKRDLETKGEPNIIIQRVEKFGISLETSFQKRVKEFKDEFRSFLISSQCLLEIFPGEDGLKDILLFCGIVLDRTITFHAGSRYGKLIFEVVEEKYSTISYK